MLNSTLFIYIRRCQRQLQKIHSHESDNYARQHPQQHKQAVAEPRHHQMCRFAVQEQVYQGADDVRQSGGRVQGEGATDRPTHTGGQVRFEVRLVAGCAVSCGFLHPCGNFFVVHLLGGFKRVFAGLTVRLTTVIFAVVVCGTLQFGVGTYVPIEVVDTVSLTHRKYACTVTHIDIASGAKTSARRSL